MDVQRYGVTLIGEDRAFLDRLTGAIEAARGAAMLVIYVIVQFREGFPEISPKNLLFSNILKSDLKFPPSATELHPAIVPLPEDVLVKKIRVSAFCGSDLEVVLRSQGISHLVLTGIATS